jgi:hypothetical protein
MVLSKRRHPPARLSGPLPSVWAFAECRISGARQILGFIPFDRFPPRDTHTRAPTRSLPAGPTHTRAAGCPRTTTGRAPRLAPPILRPVAVAAACGTSPSGRGASPSGRPDPATPRLATFQRKGRQAGRLWHGTTARGFPRPRSEPEDVHGGRASSHGCRPRHVLWCRLPSAAQRRLPSRTRGHRRPRTAPYVAGIKGPCRCSNASPSGPETRAGPSPEPEADPAPQQPVRPPLSTALRRPPCPFAGSPSPVSSPTNEPRTRCFCNVFVRKYRALQVRLVCSE